MQARHSHLVQRCVSLRVRVCPVRDIEGLATASIIQAANKRELVKRRARRGARTKYSSQSENRRLIPERAETLI